MFSIQFAAKNKMWEEAAKACASALSVLEKGSQLHILKSFLDHAKSDIGEANIGSWRVRTQYLPKLPENLGKRLPPWVVHIKDAEDNVKEIKQDSSKEYCSARIAASLWEIVFGLQVAAWAATDADDYNAWVKGEVCRGVFENKTSNDVAQSHWINIDRMIKQMPCFKNKDDLDIYQIRPAVEIFRRLFRDE